MKKLINKIFGPSTLVAAAFIGPGTITTCTLAGVSSSYSLIWALVFSTIATVILQEMSARLGFVTGEGLGEAINKKFSSGSSRLLIFFLVISAIMIGNAAYEAGNISGGILGLELLFGPFYYWPIVLGALSFFLLFQGNYKWIEKIMVLMVITMSLSFLITAIIVKPNLLEVFKGMIPKIPSNDELLLVMALIGTTVVPYNLFLHASTISKKYSKDADIKHIRLENNFSIIMGGVISIMIVITAAASSNSVAQVSSAADLATQLEPLFGKIAKIFMGIGLFAAGFSSALTAPIAAAFAAKGLFNWEDNMKSKSFRWVWIAILGIGVIVSLTGFKPIPIIKFAQIANALLLPFIAIFLYMICRSDQILGKYKNGFISNVLGALIIIITIMLGLKTIVGLF